MLIENRITYRIALIATFLALFVVMLGAYTRLKDAGLGCPDWPGCYGHVVAPNNPQRLLNAEIAFPGQTVDEAKAWTEMTHRYLAGTLGGFVVVLAFLTLRMRNLAHRSVSLALILLGVIIIQALLGKWTVTLKLLPVVVMSHLMGGMTLLSLLWLSTLRFGEFFRTAQLAPMLSRFKPWAILGLIIVVLQIFLGGWTSSNYAALICPDFPYCQGKLLPPLNWHTAFNFWTAVGPNFQGGVLDNIARVTIQMAHRFGAVITFLYISGLSFWLLASSKTPILKRIAGAMLFILLIQILLGLTNVLWLLPLPIAVAHNGVAALLLLSLVTLNYALFLPKAQDRRS